MQNQKPQKFNPLSLIIIALFIAFFINQILGVVGIIAIIFFLKKNKKYLTSFLSDYLQDVSKLRNGLTENNQLILEKTDLIVSTMPSQVRNILFNKTKIRLEKRKKYLHVALNNTLEEAEEIISQLPTSDRILIEAGTPLIKIYGTEAVSRIRAMAPAGSYIVADNKCADLAAREVEMMANVGANAATCLGVAPIETINIFIEECQKFNIDSIIDMMNVEDALAVLKKLKKLPNVVMLHRGVDETEFSKEKQIPYYQIKQIKGNYDILVAVAGGDTIREVQRATFNDADIVVVWKNFYQACEKTAQLAEFFLKEVK
jgi:3-keto-L-gulonate-6-phosphate decarboxylase